VGSLLLLAVSIGVALGLAEAGLRLLGYRGEPMSRISNIYLVDDPVLDWRYVPNSETHSGPVVYRYNGAGFRDREHALAKPAGVERIVVVGDSVTEGYGVEWKDVFASVLQTRLGERYEVINIAAGGLNTPQEVHLLERAGLKYGPDLVVLNFVLNDVDFYTRYHPAQRAGARGESRIDLLNVSVPPAVKRALKSSALVYLVNDRVQSLRETLTGGKDGGDYFSRIWASETNRRKATDGFAKLAALKTQHGFRAVVVVWPLIADYPGYRFRWIHDWVVAEATRAGLDVIDLLPQFSSSPYRSLQVSAEDTVHPNAVGHRLGAETLVAWLRSPARAGRSSAPRLQAQER
jgi:lysophospholipase L1-like esterase